MFKKKPISIYVHWPFCETKCPYCDFNSHISSSVNHDDWKEALITELEYIINNFIKDNLKNYWLKSIFFGGGTPSLMHPKTIEKIVTFCNLKFSTPPNNSSTEITLEANPNNIFKDNLTSFYQSGINRISIGVQSFNQEDLIFLGRNHSVKDAKLAIDVAMSIFNEVSFDLIYALPNQSIENWNKILTEALLIGNRHLSLYQLTIEPGTSFGRDFKNGFLIPTTEDLASDLYYETDQLTKKFGLLSYEISNYSKIGSECLHNLNYWRGGDWIGIGPGATGRISLNNDVRIQTQVRKNPTSWLKSVKTKKNGITSVSHENKRDFEIEKLIMGLRLTNGIRIDEVSNVINLEIMKMFVEEKFLEFSKNIIKTTYDGRLKLNSILPNLVL